MTHVHANMSLQRPLSDLTDDDLKIKWSDRGVYFLATFWRAEADKFVFRINVTAEDAVATVNKSKNVAW